MNTYIRAVVGAVAGMILGLAIGFAICPENILAMFGLECGLGIMGGLIGHFAFMHKQPKRRIEYHRTNPPKNPGIIGGRRPDTRPRGVQRNLRR